MKLAIEPSTPDLFDEMAAWRYPTPYELYDGDAEPVLNPERFYSARAESGALIGFLYYEDRGAGVVEIGLGLRPDLTGRGLGLDFFRAGLAFARERLAAERIVLNVAAWNERAVKVYERAGFRRTGSHVRRLERWGDVEFLEMEEAP